MQPENGVKYIFKEIELAKEEKRKYIPHVFDNGDTRRQLLGQVEFRVVGSFLSKKFF